MIQLSELIAIQSATVDGLVQRLRSVPVPCGSAGGCVARHAVEDVSDSFKAESPTVVKAQKIVRAKWKGVVSKSEVGVLKSMSNIGPSSKCNDR